MQRISAGYKRSLASVLLGFAFLGFATLAVWAELHHWTATFVVSAMAFLVIGVIGMPGALTGIFFYLVPVIFFDLVPGIFNVMSGYKVWDAGDALIVRNKGQENRIPLSAIIDVKYRITSLVGPVRIILTLRTPSIFGDTITFLSRDIITFRFRAPFFRSPIADDLSKRA